MPLDKLKKLEQSLVLFRKRYLELVEEKDQLRGELKVLKRGNELLKREKEDAKLRVESLLDIFKGLGL
ncbi:MAG: hypothetical protein RQ824_03850 [bacterium]|nr:hypothetical protein [bacterium]